MAVDLFSRYRNLDSLGVVHASRGRTLSLPIRRDEASYAPREGARSHRFSGYESHDLLSLRFYGREELYWVLLDANDRRLPEEFNPGELIEAPPPGEATRVTRSRR